MPVYKKGSKTDKANYRPVSVLTILSKVFEKVIYDQIYPVMSPLLSRNLSGYMKGHSCATAILKMTEDWRESLDNGETIATVSVDLSKVFDSVNHNLLLAKIWAYGFSEAATKLLGEYLRDPHQRVKIDGICSGWRIVKAGVPQGYLLGPLLFNTLSS